MPEVLRTTTASVRRERTLLVGLAGGRAGSTAAPVERGGGHADVRVSDAVLRPRWAPSAERGDGREALEELRRLAETAGADVVAQVALRHRRVHPGTYLGSGQVERLAEIVRAEDVDVVILDTDLAPAQAHNLEARFQSKVIDRSELILDIFATRARTRMARLQVELAQLEYIFPRLRRMWTHLERQVGGIGVRGPGEQQLESDRRIARKRILDLKEEIAHIQARRTREVSRRGREFTVSLVGYTNAGKSTLMNALTDAHTFVGDRLFSTLDTKTRRWQVDPHHRVLLSDTVGFIRHLPHHLVASFRATLEEARQASLLLHVADVSHPAALEQVAAVRAVLDELGCGDRPRLLALNKIDQLTDDTALRVLARREPAVVEISALTGRGLDALADWVRARLAESEVDVTVRVPQENGRLLSDLAGSAQVLDRRSDDGGAVLDMRIGRGRLEQLRKMHPDLALVSPASAEAADDDADAWPDVDLPADAV